MIQLITSQTHDTIPLTIQSPCNNSNSSPNMKRNLKLVSWLQYEGIIRTLIKGLTNEVTLRVLKEQNKS